MGCKVYAQTKDSQYVSAMHRCSSSKLLQNVMLPRCFRIRMMPLLMQQAFLPWHQIKAIYWLTQKGQEYFSSLKIILDFTDEVSITFQSL